LQDYHASRDHPEDSILREYGRVLWRRKWIVLSAAIAAPVVAVLLSLQQTAKYEATSQVLLSRQNLAASLAGLSDPSLSQPADRFAQTQADLARVPDVAEQAIEAAGLQGTRTPSDLLSSSSVVVEENSDILDFKVTDQDPAVATKLATAYATAFTVYRQELDVRGLRVALEEIEKSMSKLEAAGETDSALYQSLSDKREQLRTLEALETSNAYVVQPAGSAGKVQPRPVRNGIFGLLIGLTVGVILAFVVEALDTRPRSASEVSRQLGLPLLARLPAPRGRLRKTGELVTLAAPTSVEAEAFRVLRTNLELVNLTLKARTILVTSAAHGEGKSTTAANLAVALANEGQRVLLVDLDLRQPALRALFEPSVPILQFLRRPGLVDVVLGRASIEAALIPLSVSEPARAPAPSSNGAGQEHASNGAGGNGSGRVGPGSLELLTAGAVPENAGELIGAQALGALLEDLSGRADVVLVDSPPLLQVGDGLALSRHVDAMLVVSRMGTARRSTLTEMRRVLETCPAPKLGFVLTNVAPSDGYGTAAGYYGYQETRSARLPAGTAGA
jgi:Mrp family chromosome partitioning ATPase/capsular polysaccharide biosynthesis protein